MDICEITIHGHTNKKYVHKFEMMQLHAYGLNINQQEFLLWII